MIEDYLGDNSILAKPEDFKGIIYVRLSALPVEQGAKIRESHYRHSIVKILKDNSLMSDCMIYNDYMEWHKQGGLSTVNTIQKATPIQPEFSNSELIYQ